MTRLLVCGLTTADFVFNIEALPERAEKYIAHDAQAIVGGGAANAAIAIARQGADASLAARIGDDSIGRTILQTLHDENIDCSFLHINDQATSSFSSVLIDAEGERQIVNFRGTGFNRQPTWLTDDIPPQFKNNPSSEQPFNAVLTDTRWTEGAVAVLKMAKQRGIPGVVDAEAPIDDEVLACASHVAFSKQGLEAYTGIQNIEDALLFAHAKLQTWVCVTDGGNGVLHIEDGICQHTPTPDMDIRDTLAAGDVWHGVFTLRLAEGLDEQRALQFANAAATLKCGGTATGSMAAPNRELTEKLVKEFYD